MKNIIFEYDDLDSFQEYLYSLPVKDSFKLLQVISLIEEYRIQQAQKMEWTKKL